MRKTAPDHAVHIDSPVGRLTLASRGGKITHLLFGEHFAETDADEVIREAMLQLQEYFSGKRESFTLPLAPEGTDFQQAVWRALLVIPYGETASYGDIARAIERPKACRAVGQANHVNPISIIIPCHRVVGAKGDLTGYGGGMAAKTWLLALEKRKSMDKC